MTVEIPTTRGFVALVDEVDAALVAGYSWHVAISGEEPNVQRYAHAHIPGSGSGGSNIKMHRLIMGAPPRMDVDHRDHDGLNNRRENLRLATRSQNMANGRIRPDNTSGFRGVTWDVERGAWRAQIMVAGRKSFLGRFPSAEEAARAYDAAVLEAFGEFATLNFPGESK